MTRPEHVRCENCCYFDGPYFSEHSSEMLKIKPHFYGMCRRAHNRGEITDPKLWCGEFRAEWPEEVPPRFGITSGCICGKCDSCIDRGVTP